jgi:hypothetical protein
MAQDLDLFDRRLALEAVSSSNPIPLKRSPTGIYNPAMNEIKYASQDVQDRTQLGVPSTMQSDFGTLEAYLDSKVGREHLKLCAFYNKFFPSITFASAYAGATYNAPPFSILDQEVTDVGSGMSENYLKVCIDTIVSRLKNISFQVRIQSSTPLILLEMHRSSLERYFKSQIRSNRLEHLVTECFHDSAILGYSHVFMDPWSKKVRKINDFELGIYEAEFEKRDLKRVMLKDEAFPVASLAPYVEGFDHDTLKRLVSQRSHIRLYLYMDCFQGKKFAMIENTAGPLTDYPFDKVLLETFIWDIGVKRTYTTSMFDLLFPLQRQINKFNAKRSTLYTNYKGTVPVISTAGDVDAVVKNLTNKSGEVLVLSGAVADVTKMIGQIDPIPLNPTINAEIQALKAAMLELAGVQEISLDLGSLRSAAAVVALDQLRDVRFENQMFQMAEFVGSLLTNIVRFNAGLQEPVGDIPWEQMLDLIDSAYIEIIPIHGLDPEKKPVDPPEDFQLYAVNRFLMDVINGKSTFDNADYTINRDILKKQVVNRLLRFKAMGGDFRSLEELAVRLFVEDIRKGVVSIVGVSDASASPAPPPAAEVTGAPPPGGGEADASVPPAEAAVV